MAAGNKRRHHAPHIAARDYGHKAALGARAQDAGREHNKRHRRYGDVGGVAVQVRDAVDVAGESQYGEHEHGQGEVLRDPEAMAGPPVQVQQQAADQDEVQRGIESHPVRETGRGGFRGEPPGEQELVDARLQAEKDLDQPGQAEEDDHEGAYP
jgi:hypothetical protein